MAEEEGFRGEEGCALGAFEIGRNLRRAPLGAILGPLRIPSRLNEVIEALA